MIWSIALLISLSGSLVQDPPDGSGKRPVVDTLVIQHEVTGRPGSAEESTVLQNAFVTADRVLVEDRSRGVLRILRLDQPQPVLWEVSEDGKFYRETRDLGKIQKDRLEQERQLVERTAQLPAEERAALLSGNHIRLSDDGELVREITVEENDTDETRLELPVRNVRVLENGRLIADFMVADVDIPFSLIRFHSASGAFSKEVLVALEKIQGLPLEGSIQVVTATLSHPLRFRVVSWKRAAEFPLSAFELPEGCQKIEETPFVNCPICGTEVEREASAARARKRDGTWCYFDQRSCFQQWRLQRLKEN